MRSKTVLVLVGVVVVLAALAAVTLRSGDDDAKQSPLGQKAFADLPFEKIDKIRVVSDGEAATIGKKPGGWGVLEKGGYPADFAKISDLVEKLRESKVGRRFAADPQIRDRLGLHPPSRDGIEAEQRAKQLMLLDAQGNPLADLLIGKARESDRGFGGHYLMRTGQPTVLLVDQTFRFLSAAPDQWLHRQVIDLDTETIESVAFYRSGGDTPVYELRRPETGKDFVFAGGEPGAAGVDQGKAGRLVEALSPLNAEDVLVAEAAGKDISFAGADRFLYTTFTGRSYGLELGPSFSKGEETFTYARMTQTPPPGADKEPDEYRGWIYVLSEWKAGDFIKDRKELLAAEAE